MIGAALKARYLRDPMPLRLGGLAADLARIASCVGNPKNRQMVLGLMEESKYFAEWAALDAPLEVQEQLADLQRTVAWWERCWTAGREDPSVSQEADRRAEDLLKLAGLI